MNNDNNNNALGGNIRWPSLLDSFTNEEMATLFEYTDIAQFFAGDTVIVKGEIDRAVSILIKGSLEVVKNNSATGARVRLASVPVGLVIGELAFFDGLPRSESVVALTDGELLVLRWDSFQRLSNKQPILAAKFLNDIGCMLALKFRRLQDSGHHFS